jgi:hypothetical protein
MGNVACVGRPHDLSLSYRHLLGRWVEAIQNADKIPDWNGLLPLICTRQCPFQPRSSTSKCPVQGRAMRISSHLEGISLHFISRQGDEDNSFHQVGSPGPRYHGVVLDVPREKARREFTWVIAAYLDTRDLEMI